MSQKVFPFRKMTLYFDTNFKLLVAIISLTLSMLYLRQSLSSCNLQYCGLFGQCRDNVDHFEDLEQLLQMPRTKHRTQHFERVIIRIVQSKMTVPTLGNLFNIKQKHNDTSLKRFQMKINLNDLYRESDPIVAELLNDLATLPISSFHEMPGGTQFKLIAVFNNGMKALFKPIRFPIEKQENPNNFHYSYFENARAEIAAFHLDRALGFRRAMPTVGRKINLITDLYEKGPDNVRTSFFNSPANNTCFYGECHWYCNMHHPICGKGHDLEGSFAAFLPEWNDEWSIHILEMKNPWAKVYGKSELRWENSPEFCNQIKNMRAYNSSRRVIDMTDMAIFDFLLDNQDRHDYDYMVNLGRASYNIHLDHGRAFGRAFFDETIILTPLKQCCQIRESTLKALLTFHNGPKRLSMVMKESLANDPLAPVLWEPHLKALDRRLRIVLEHVRDCLSLV